MGAFGVLAVEVLALYMLGSYAMSGLGGLLSSGTLSRLCFYLFVVPGVSLHESAHYLACVLLRLRVGKFVPFSPKEGPDGRTQLGRVEHAYRDPVSGALVGVAPMILNPLAVVLILALLTPLSFSEVFAQSAAALSGGGSLTLGQALAGAAGFVAANPLRGALLAYLLLSFSLGSVLSREDLSGVPVAAVILAAAAFAVDRFTEADLLTAFVSVAEPMAAIYVLPTIIAAAAALAVYVARNAPAGAHGA